jgi:hypothetical protein
MLVEGSSWTGYGVWGGGDGVGDWACTQDDPATARLTCRLPAGSTAYDLGLDLQTDDPGSVRFTMAPSDPSTSPPPTASAG